MLTSPSEIANLTRDVSLVSIDSLRSYEQVDPRRVAAIAHSLRAERTLFDPIVADEDLGLLIDGHHRAAAFNWIGLRSIPCFNVRYLSSQVTVRGWSRATDASPSEMLAAFDWFDRADEGAWHVLAEDQDGERIASAAFERPNAAAHWLDHLAFFLEGDGHAVDFVPRTGPHDLAPRPRFQTSLYLDPVPEKQEVLAAMRGDGLYPQQVNRHLVNDRPLGLHVPLHSSRTAAAFEDFLETAQAQSEVLAEAGVTYKDRWFEERVRICRDLSRPN